MKHEPQMLSASVVLPTHNKSRYLDLTLASYVKQVVGRYELVVVDDGSTDDTVQVVQRYADQLPLKFVQQGNAGRSAARNAGIRAATGDVIVFSDDDRIVPPSFVADHLRAFGRVDEPLLVLGWQRGIVTRWCPEIADDERVRHVVQSMGGPPVGNGDAGASHPGVPLLSVPEVVENFDAAVHALGVSEPWWEAYCLPLLREFPDPSEFRFGWTIGTTGNMSLTRVQLDTVGLFDERFTGWGLEDTELCYRLVRHGVRIAVSQPAVSYHQVHPRSERRRSEWMVNFTRFRRKHPGIDMLLYLLLCQRRMTLRQVHEIAGECEMLMNEGRPLLVEELARQYRAQAFLRPSTGRSRIAPAGVGTDVRSRSMPPRR